MPSFFDGIFFTQKKLKMPHFFYDAELIS